LRCDIEVAGAVTAGKMTSNLKWSSNQRLDWSDTTDALPHLKWNLRGL